LKFTALNIMNLIKKYNIEITVFVSGAAVMIYEIVGTRILAPYLGTTIFVWTSIIGVILASLSLGYVYGGRISDKSANAKYLSNVLFIAGIIIFVTNLVSTQIVAGISQVINSLRLQSVAASLVLFTPASILLGVVTPYSVKLRLKDLGTGGKVVGNLTALSTLGSIFGTFIAGFYLFTVFKTLQIITLLSIIITIVSLLLKDKGGWQKYLIALVIYAYHILTARTISLYAETVGMVDTDTLYSRVLVFTGEHKDTKRQIRVMQVDAGMQSVKYVDSPELVVEYTKYYDLLFHFNPEVKEVLMLGGAGYSYPQYFVSTYSDVNMDVVEIDPGITKIAKEHFGLKEWDNLNIIHEDARTYINRKEKTYDVILIDAFSGMNVPFSLTTLEFTKYLDESLSENGAIFTNVISTLEGEKSHFLSALYNTYKEVFPFVSLYLPDAGDPHKTQNMLLVASKVSRENLNLNPEQAEEKLRPYLENEYDYTPETNLVLTDVYAPVEVMMEKTLH
jgi:spermidine synthase